MKIQENVRASLSFQRLHLAMNESRMQYSFIYLHKSIYVSILICQLIFIYLGNIKPLSSDFCFNCDTHTSVYHIHVVHILILLCPGLTSRYFIFLSISFSEVIILSSPPLTLLEVYCYICHLLSLCHVSPISFLLPFSSFSSFKNWSFCSKLSSFFVIQMFFDYVLIFFHAFFYQFEICNFS